MKHRILSLLTASCAAITCVAAGFTAMHIEAAENDSDVLKIMAVGDSITDGYINGDNGYRKYFCYGLQQAGVTNFDMVGSCNNWINEATYTTEDGVTITYDPNHEGHSGYSIQSYGGRTGIYETLFNNGDLITTYDPDIVMLQIGTNDLLDANNDGITDRLETLINRIEESLDSDAVLFVASVPDIDVEVRNDWLGNYQWTYNIPSYSEDPENYIKVVTECVDAYNASVKALVEKKQAEGYNIYFSDINSVVDMKTGLYDGVHPNEYGYSCMGEYWSSLILSYLNETPVVTTSTVQTIETTTTTITTTATETTTTLTTQETTTETFEETTATTEMTSVTESSATEIVETSETTATSTESTETTAETTDTSTSATTELRMGDVNLDEIVNLADVIYLQRYLLGDTPFTYRAYLQADLTQDAQVDGLDLTALRQLLLNQV